MKKVYVVSTCVDDEYGCMEACKVFATREDAEAWVNAQEDNGTHEAWYGEYEQYSIEEFEVC